MEIQTNSDGLKEKLENSSFGNELKEYGFSFISRENSESLFVEMSKPVSELPEDLAKVLFSRVNEMLLCYGCVIGEQCVYVSGDNEGGSPVVTIKIEVKSVKSEKPFSTCHEELDGVKDEIRESIGAVRRIRKYDGATCFGRSRNKRGKGL